MHRFVGLAGGEIRSPVVAGGQYPPNQDCLWYIDAPGATDVLELELLEMNIEINAANPTRLSTYCPYDYIRVRTLVKYDIPTYTLYCTRK